MPLRLVFLGPPGSGKGTQAERLEESHQFVQLSSGQVLREEMRAQSEIGRRAATFVNEGELVPDDVITAVMLAAIDKLEPQRGLVLDGFPRTLAQAKNLDAGFVEREGRVDAVLDFVIGDDEIVRRIAKRRVCNKCGHTYNAEFLPPQREGVCDACGGEVVHRVDDQPDVVVHRIETYHAQTEPLIAFYRDRGMLHEIDAAQAAEAVEAQVQTVVERLISHVGRRRAD